jgi:hypothetical protein
MDRIPQWEFKVCRRLGLEGVGSSLLLVYFGTGVFPLQGIPDFYKLIKHKRFGKLHFNCPQEGGPKGLPRIRSLAGKQFASRNFWFFGKLPPNNRNPI